MSVGHGVLLGAEGVLHVHLVDVAPDGRERDDRLVLTDARGALEGDAGQQAAVARVVDTVLVERLRAGRAVDEAGGRRVGDAELGLELGHRRGVAHEDQGLRRHLEVQFLDVLHREAGPPAQLHDPVDDGVGHESAGVGLETVHLDRPALAEVPEQGVHVEDVAVAPEPLGSRVERRGVAREPPLREQGALDTARPGTAEVQRFGHGAEDGRDARPLGGPESDRVRGLIRRESEQAAGRDRDGHRADDAGAVPPAVGVVRVHGQRQPGLQLEPDDERRQQLAVLRPGTLTDGQQGRQQRSTGMDAGRQQGVVEVEHVRRHAVDERGVDDVRAPGVAGERRPRRPTDLVEVVEQEGDGLVGAPAQRDAQGVDDRPAGRVHHSVGQVLVPDAGRPVEKCWVIPCSVATSVAVMTASSRRRSCVRGTRAAGSSGPRSPRR